MRALLVVNRHSLRGRRLGDRVARELAARGVEVIPFPHRRAPNEMPACDAIVAVGGDGTIVRLIGRAMSAGVPIGIVPSGTFNELARTLNVPLDVGAACEVIARGHSRLVDVGHVNGAWYLSEASIGISSRAARMQTSDLKQRLGYFAVLTTALQALWYARPMFAEVTYDDNVVTFKTVQVTVANSHRFGGVFNVSDAGIDDGWLDLYSVEIETFSQAFHVARAACAARESIRAAPAVSRARRETPEGTFRFRPSTNPANRHRWRRRKR